MNPCSAPETVNQHRVIEYDKRLSVRPRYGEAAEEGFALSGTPFILRLNVLNTVNIGESLSRMSWWSRLTSLRVKYFRMRLCRACGCYIVDSSEVLSHAEAKRLADTEEPPAA